MSDAPNATPGAAAAKPKVKVLDAWALLSWLKDQRPAADRVEALWPDAEQHRIQLLVSIINLGEVFYMSAKALGLAQAEVILDELQALPLEVRPAPNGLVLEAARLKGQYPISYADAFAVALAQKEGAPIVTGDPELRALAARGVVAVEWIGR